MTSPTSSSDSLHGAPNAEAALDLARTADADASEHLNAELLSTFSHELRSPLAVIKGYASTLLRHESRLSRAERHEFLAAIVAASDQLDATISRLLRFAALEAGDAPLDRFAVDLMPIVFDATANASGTSAMQERAPTTITVRLQDEDGRDAEREPLIFADPRAMQELLGHLLENAVKYSPQGGEVTVTLRPTERSSIAAPGQLAPDSPGGARYLEVVVRDQGIGIPDEHLGRIFERFHRVDTRLTREVDGLGIGLAICRRIVELHGGVIWAESQPGTGSVFSVLLPVAT
jgi:signal transduction histidine kinase